MLADLVFLLALFYGLVLGARRGFFKEVVQVVAVVVGVAVARLARVPAGAVVSSKTGAPLLLAEVAAVCLVWVAAFLVTAVVGRLLLKKLRGKGVDDRLDDGAEKLADAIAGDTTKGPVTLLTDPIASKRGFFYWSDKLLGALLGLLKGVITGYAIFGLVLWADRIGYPSAFARSVEASHAGALFVERLDPLLRASPEYQLATKTADVHEIARLVEADPARIQRVADHPELAALARDPQVQALGRDPEVRAAWERRDLKALLADPRVHALLADPVFREKAAAVDWAKVRAAVADGRPATPGAGASPGPAPR